MLKKSFNPHQSFLSLSIVWYITLTLIAISLVIAICIIANTDIHIDLSANGFNECLSIFKFPLGVLAIIIPIIALLAANHRSEQTKEQIRLSNEQNQFSNYYKHIEEFEKYLQKHFNNTTHFESPRRLHKLLFPKASTSDFSINYDLLTEFHVVAEEYLKLTHTLVTSPKENRDSVIADLANVIDNFAEKNSIVSYKGLSGNQITYKNKSIIIEGGDFKNFILQIKKVAIIIDGACSFDPNYITPTLTKTITSIDNGAISQSMIGREYIESSLDLSGYLHASTT